MCDQTRTSGGEFWADVDDDQTLQRYRNLVDAVGDGIYQLDADGRFVAVNEIVVERTGYARDDLLGEHVSLVLADGDLDRVEGIVRDLAEAERTGRAETIEYPVRTADGRFLDCEHRLTPIPETGGNGEPGVAGVLRLPETASPSEEESVATPPDHVLANILDEADSVGVFVLDSGFEVAWVDETIERYFGVDREAVVGRDKRRVIEAEIRPLVDDPDRVEETVLATYDDNTYIERFTFRVTAGDDRQERWLEHLSKPITDGPYAGGRVELYYDVSEQHQRAHQLRQLNVAVREWLEERSREAVAERASSHLRDILDMEINGVYLYDSAAAKLRPGGWSASAETLFGEMPTFAEGEGIAWRVYESGRPEIYDDVRDAPDVYNSATPVRSEIVLPIGDHGVLIVGSEQRDAFDDGDLMLAKVVASSLESTFGRIHHERRLERERDLIDRLLETSPVGILVLDDEGEITRTNERITELLDVDDVDGYSPSDRPTYDEDGAPIPADEHPFRRAVESGDPVYDEVLRVELPDDGRRWLSVDATPMLTDDGEIDRVVATAEDVTAFKERERRLERRTDELAAELEEIYGRITDGFMALNGDWEMTHLNERAEEILGVHDDEPLGGTIWETFPELLDTTFERRYREALETQESVSFVAYHEPTDSWYEEHVYPSETGLSVYFRDVTERKRRKRELQEKERRYQAIFNDPNILVGLLEPDGAVVDINQTAMEYIEADLADVTGVPFWETPWWGDGDGVQSEVKEWTERAADGEYVDFEADLTRPDGDRYTLSGYFRPVTDEDGEVVSIIVSDRDVTERKERERQLEELVEKLEESNERLEQFAYAASHDLQEPLRMVSSYLRLIEERYGDDLDGDAEEFIEFAVDGADRMREMIDGLLAYARVETEGEPFEPVELDAILSAVREDLQVKLEESDAELTVEDLPRVDGDASQLRQVFQNLLENAIEYSGDEPPRVRVSAERDDTEWAVSVRDEGVGIDPDHAESIFQVFERLHTNDEHAGTGIGLALCERIVERHGGEIWVESEPGEGATFSFTLPAAGSRRPAGN